MKIILLILLTVISFSVFSNNTDPDYLGMNGIQICKAPGVERVDNQYVGYTLCKINLSGETRPAAYGLAIFYQGILFNNPTYFDDYAGQSVNKLITVGLRMNGGKFFTFTMKTRSVPMSEQRYAQLVIHPFNKYYNEYSRVSFNKNELKGASDLFKRAFDARLSPIIWDIDFYFVDNLGNYDSNLSRNYYESLPKR